MIEIIQSKILFLRHKSVMLDSDLAKLYNVETKRINEQVRRNVERFPDDFMFQLTEEEWNSLRSQNATANQTKRRFMPYAFTEHGILMLSSVLKSSQAVEVNIQIMRTFVEMRKLLSSQKELLTRLLEIEGKTKNQDDKILKLFNYVQQFIRNDRGNKEIGY